MDWDKPIFYRGEVLSVEVNRARGFTEKQLNRLLDVVQKMLVIINSLEFKINVTNMVALEDSNGKTPMAIYEMFMSGKDIYESDEDRTLNVDITLVYKRFSRVVGWTYSGSRRTFFNRKFWRNDEAVAGNIIHEYLHNLGFFDRAGSNSVTYVYGNVVTKLMKELKNGRQFIPVKKDMIKYSGERSSTIGE
jgi:hypothetical protein